MQRRNKDKDSYKSGVYMLASWNTPCDVVRLDFLKNFSLVQGIMYNMIILHLFSSKERVDLFQNFEDVFFD